MSAAPPARCCGLRRRCFRRVGCECDANWGTEGRTPRPDGHFQGRTVGRPGLWGRGRERGTEGLGGTGGVWRREGARGTGEAQRGSWGGERTAEAGRGRSGGQEEVAGLRETRAQGVVGGILGPTAPPAAPGWLIPVHLPSIHIAARHDPFPDPQCPASAAYHPLLCLPLAPVCVLPPPRALQCLFAE